MFFRRADSHTRTYGDAYPNPRADRDADPDAGIYADAHRDVGPAHGDPNALAARRHSSADSDPLPHGDADPDPYA